MVESQAAMRRCLAPARTRAKGPSTHCVPRPRKTGIKKPPAGIWRTVESFLRFISGGETAVIPARPQPPAPAWQVREPLQRR